MPGTNPELRPLGASPVLRFSGYTPQVDQFLFADHTRVGGPGVGEQKCLSFPLRERLINAKSVPWVGAAPFRGV